MPTNKLWIEHTEHAAWESVTALRRELAETKKRIERMAPPTEGWRDLLDALEASQKEHALGGKTYADVLRGLVDQLNLSQTRLRAAQAQLARTSYALSSPPPAPDGRAGAEPLPDPEPPPMDDGREFAVLARRFVRAMQHRYAALGPEIVPLEVDELLGAIEANVDALAATSEDEMAPAAVDLALLALCLYAQARRNTSP